MIPRRIIGANAVATADGCVKLHLLSTVMQLGDGSEVPVQVSSWEPSPDEVQRLLAGASLYLYVITTPDKHPPVAVEVVSVLDEKQGAY